MKRNTMLIPTAMLALALAGPASTDAAQRDRNGRDRNGRQSQGQAERRQGQGSRQGQQGGRVQRQQESRPQGRVQAPPSSSQAERPNSGAGARPQTRADRGQDRGRSENFNRGGTAVPRPNYSYRNDDWFRDNRRSIPQGRAYRDGRYRYDDRYRYYGGARIVPGWRAPRHYYGPGGNFSVYFGWGSGYLFGTPYYGRVYGYRGTYAYGARIYYGDIRLQVRPRNAAVYVDGYYAGIVDDFDGIFQRLTLEAGPHQIELDAPGLEPQFFDIYVDPARTVNIRADLYAYPY